MSKMVSSQVDLDEEFNSPTSVSMLSYKYSYSLASFWPSVITAFGFITNRAEGGAYQS